MARDIGNASLGLGTGSKSINIGMLATYMQIVVKGPGLKSFQGWIRNGLQYCYPADGESLNTTRAIKVKDTSGTVVLEATFTSFSGTNVNFNVLTNTGTAPDMLLIFGN